MITMKTSTKRDIINDIFMENVKNIYIYTKKYNFTIPYYTINNNTNASDKIYLSFQGEYPLCILNDEKYIISKEELHLILYIIKHLKFEIVKWSPDSFKHFKTCIDKLIIKYCYEN